MQGTAGKKRATSSPTPLSQKQSMLDVLEHVVRIGSYLKHEALRVQAWRVKNIEATESSAISPKKRKWHKTSQSKPDDIQIFAEDVRLYATKEWFENCPWPRKQRRVQEGEGHRPDNDFDKELGDGIHPVAFAAARLSSIPRDAESLERCASMDLDPDASECDVKTEDAPQALLLRCWERAVHAAASTIPMTDKMPRKPYNFIHSMTAARARCKSLGCELPSSAKQLKCPSCDASFSEVSLLDSHYYGTKNTRGCSWSVIEKEEHSIIARILSREVEGQLDSLLRFIISRSKSRKQELSNQSDAVSSTMDWNDILGMLQSALESSKNVDDQVETEANVDHPPQLETLDFEHSGTPLLINSTMIASLRRRLESRYNDSLR